jgi:hypothetical protein
MQMGFDVPGRIARGQRQFFMLDPKNPAAMKIFLAKRDQCFEAI